MDKKTKTRLLMLDMVFLCLFLKTSFSVTVDTISEDNALSAGSTIVSAQGVFEMGFFQPGPTPNYYVGIWYQKDPSRRPVWVANRDKPVSFSSDLRISDRNLVLFDESKTPIWSTNVSITTRSVQAVLLDSGNLVLRDGSNSSHYLWQSFDHPTHTWLPGAKLGYSKITKTSQVLTSWKNENDPAPGLFSLQLDPSKNSFNLLWNESTNYWTSGSWDGKMFSLIPEMSIEYIYSFSYEANENEISFTYILKNTSVITSHFEIDVSGKIKQSNWLPNSSEWTFFWSEPTSQCTVFSLCGAYGSCSENSLTSCACLRGFEPKSRSDWDLKDYSSGCVRKNELQCGNNSGVANRKRDRFLEVPGMSLPDNKQHVETENSAECESKCLNNCSCTAYFFDSIVCSIWTGDLLNLKQLGGADSNRLTLNVRVTASEYWSVKRSSRKRKLYVVSFGSIAVAVFTTCTACFVYYMRRKRVTNGRGNKISFQENLREEEKNGINVPFVALKSILAATDNFSEANRLGQGGFGPVYKGKFPGGEEIAIKRLSSGSGQGLEEFKNEVLLIARLQHRNLVRLLGYCVEGDEKILLYEYMPNKSLDSFIFDRELCVLLSWDIRFNIILGIARGLVYLHHDSRLRVVHRDLKTSNVLLDEDMNPKISDFGLARIFEGKQSEANTTRVVGTYGYMSPEYVLKGLFSIKSDVFGFGVVILEIISGKRNTGFHQSERASSLLGYTWKLWTENKALDLVDEALRENCNSNEFLRCVSVGLLCVQEDPSDRPNMSNVVAMLRSESGSLARPKQPAFVVSACLSSGASSDDRPLSNNTLTDTLNQGR